MGFSYPWTRYWVQRGPSSAHDGGYLAVPEAEYAWAYDDRPRTLADFHTTPVLVLLGEPGMGKSRSLADEASRLRELRDESTEILYRNLNEYGPGELNRLHRDIFESTAFVRYREGAALHLLLDSLDECKLSLTNLAAWLGAQLQENVVAADRFHLRIGCRNGAWPGGLESRLREQFQDAENAHSVNVLELCPLRREDVAVAARTQGADAEKFLEAVGAREIEPLAARPITLDLLLRLWLTRDLPRSKVDVYRRGMETLCEEHNPDRRDAGHVGTLTARQRLRIAGRIAVSLIFCNRSALWAGAGISESDGDFAISELAGAETADVGQFIVDDRAVNETLAIAGLFSPRGEQRFGFAHQSYAEFLAAWYLAESKTISNRTLGLLRHPESKELVPQLVETAGWLASLDEQTREHLIREAPHAMMTCDGATLTDGDRQRLADQLLAVFETSGVSSYDFTREQWRKLYHPGLAFQLQSVFADRQRAAVVRDLTLDIARYCHLGSLCGAAITLALDPDENPWVRLAAAQLVTEVGDTDALRALRPLALKDADTEPEIRIRELVLTKLGLEFLSAEEFFSALSKTLRPLHVGRIHLLLDSNEFIESLAPDHLPVALSWVAIQARGLATDHSLRQLAFRILRLAFDYLDRLEILNSLGETVLTLWREDQPLFHGWNEAGKENPLADSRQRRTLLFHLMHRIDCQEISGLVFAEEPLARQEDIPWLLDLIEGGLAPSDHRTAAELISALLRFNSPPEFLNRVLECCEKPDLVLRKSLRWLVHPMRLKLKATQDARADWHRWAERERSRRERQPMEPPPAVRVEQALKRCEHGALETWPGLAMELTLRSDSRHYGFPTKISDQPGWEDAEECVRQRILTVALRYVQSVPPPDDDIIDHRTHDLRQLAGGIALELLTAVAPAMLDQVSAGDRAKWAAVILTYHIDHEQEAVLFKWTYGASQRRFLDLVVRVLDERNKDENGVFNLGDFDCIWGDPLRERLEAKLTDAEWSQKSKENLLVHLAEHGVRRAIEYCRDGLEVGSDVEERSFAGSLLLKHDASASWPRLSAAFETDPDFGQRVVGNVAYESRWAEGLPSRLTESQLADLYLWLESWFPRDSDPRLEGTYTMQHAVADLRRRALSTLEGRGSLEAVQAIVRVRNVLARDAWLDRVLNNARTNYLRASWEPACVRDLLLMLSDPSKRLVRTGDELLAVVMEKLTVFQTEAQSGSPPLAVFLWDERSVEPKSEPRLSDFLKHWLKCELSQTNVIVNREVEIRNWNAKGVGSRTDLLVEAKASSDSIAGLPTVSVVIEVKGSWNIDLDDVERQLRDEYLDGQSRRHGIFLVGWFGSDHAKPKSMTKEELTARLAEKADELSTDEKAISSFVVDLTHREMANRVPTRGRKRKPHA